MPDAEPTTRRTILLRLQFEGTDFAGWQAQPQQRTVQGVVTRAVEGMVHHEVAVRATSRTDAGVHARDLPVAFETPRTIPLVGFQRGLNAALPDDVAVVDARERPPGWRPRDAAVAKTYVYRLQLGPAPLPLHARQSWYLRRDELDREAMQRAADELLGEHDFSAFRASGCDARSPWRRLHHLDVVPGPEPELLELRITGNAFLRNMARILAGTLTEVGSGRRTPAEVAEVLASRDRTRAGITAPARGLTLHAVHFEGYPAVGKPAAQENGRR